MNTTETIAGDVLAGAGPIAMFLYGDTNMERKVYHLVNGNKLPVFRIGKLICARKSTLLNWIAAQETGAIFETTP